MSAGKYFAVARTAVRHSLASRGTVVARALFLVVILVVFSRLWAALAGEGRIAGHAAVDLVWYIALTEWVTLGAPNLSVEIQQDVRRGDVAYRIARPASWLLVTLADGAGRAAVRLVVLAVTGFVAAWLVTGGLPAAPGGLLLAIPIGVLATLVIVLFETGIGLSAFWIEDSAPVRWIWQKLLFVLGGLLFPLDIYPHWLKVLAEWSPFGPLVYGCGRMSLAFDPRLALLVLLEIAAWGTVLFLALGWLYQRALARIAVNGG